MACFFFKVVKPTNKTLSIHSRNKTILKPVIQSQTSQKSCVGRHGHGTTNVWGGWMSQEVSKCLVNGLFHLLINRVYWGYNPLIRSPLILPSSIRGCGKTYLPGHDGSVRSSEVQFACLVEPMQCTRSVFWPHSSREVPLR